MQHREWNPKAFFKKISPPVQSLLEARFGFTLVRDRARPPAEQAYHAWKALPEPERRALETRLLPVNDLCSAHARPYLDSLAQQLWGCAQPELLLQSRGWPVHDLALRLFVDEPRMFLATHQRYAVDTMDHFHEYRGRYAVQLHASAGAKERLRDAMAEHFRCQAGSARCQVEDYHADDKLALFIYHEDAVTAHDTFDDSGLVVPLWIRPVVRIAAVYYPESCTLLVKAPRKREREKLRDLFAEIVVGDPGFFEDAATTPKFSFAALADPRFAFTTHPADGIDSVGVTWMRVRPPHAGVCRLTLEFEPNLTLVEVRQALLQHGIRLDETCIDGVHLQFAFAEGKGRARLRTVSLANPNSTNLKDTPRDRVIRRYLQEWHIDASRSDFALAVPAVQAAARG